MRPVPHPKGKWLTGPGDRDRPAAPAVDHLALATQPPHGVLLTIYDHATVCWCDDPSPVPSPDLCSAR